MNCKKVVALSGPDGSGKTTQALLLKKYLMQKGYKHIVIYKISGTHTMSYILACFLKKIVKQGELKLHYLKVPLPDNLLSFWVVLEFVSIIPHLVLILLFNKLGYIVILDRSFLDFLVWILSGLYFPAKRFNKIAYFVLKVIMSIIIKMGTVLLITYPSILFSRKPFDYKLIKNRYPYYVSIARSLKLYEIDTGAESPSRVMMRILEQFKI